MIAARVLRRGGRFELTLEGHAGYAPRGYDIVCAGASMLLYALAGTLEARGDKAEVTLEPGRGQVACAGGGEVGALFEMAAVGLCQLAESYPDNITIRTEGFSAQREEKT